MYDKEQEKVYEDLRLQRTAIRDDILSLLEQIPPLEIALGELRAELQEKRKAYESIDRKVSVGYIEKKAQETEAAKLPSDAQTVAKMSKEQIAQLILMMEES